MKSKPNSFIRTAFWQVAALFVPCIASAATGTWNGGPGATWDTSSTNWSGVTDPGWDATNGPLNIAIFNTAGATPSVSGTVFANAITFSDTATISNGTITLDGPTPTITATADATIGSALAGAAGLVKAGSGVLVLSNSLGYSGTTTISAGTLALAADNLIYTGGITATATLRLDHPNAAAGSAVTLNNNSTLGLRSDTSATFNIGSFAAITSANRIINLNADRPAGGSGINQVLSSSVGLSSNKLVTCNVTTANGYQLSIPQVLSTFGGGTGYTLNTLTADTKLFLGEARSTYTGGSNPTLTFSGPGNIEIGTTGVTATTKQLIGIFNQTGTVTINGPWTYAGVGTSSQINSGTVIFKNNSLGGLKLANIGGGGSAPVIDNQGASITNISSGGTAGTTTFNGDFTFGSADTTGTLTLGTNNYNLGTAAQTTRTLTIAGKSSNLLILSRPIADGINATTPTTILAKDGVGGLTLSGVNTFTGGITLTGSGVLNLQNSAAAGTGAIRLRSTQSGANTTLAISGGVSIANAIEMDSTTGREAIVSSGTGNNSLTGGISITGAANNALVIANNQTSGNLAISGGVSGPTYFGSISLRGTQAGAKGFLNGVVSLSSDLQTNGTTDWTINAVGSTYNGTRFINTGSILIGANNGLATNAQVYWSTGSTGKLDMNGFSQSVAGLNSSGLAALGAVTNNGATESTLTLANLVTNYTFSGALSDGLSNKLALEINSAGRTQTLTGNNSHTGSTTVTAGTLALVGCSLASPVTVQNAALLGFTLGSPSTSTAAVTLDSGARVRVTGTPVSPTEYTLMTAASISGIPVLESPVTGYKLTVEGTTTLKLVPITAGGYATWIDGFSVGDLDQPGDDFDNDGIENLLEFVLNGDPESSDTGILPDLIVTATHFEFTFQRRDDSLSPETTQTFQYGGDLSGWTDVIIPADSGPVGDAIITISAGIPDGGITDTVKVAILKTEESNGKLFGRLQITQP